MRHDTAHFTPGLAETVAEQQKKKIEGLEKKSGNNAVADELLQKEKVLQKVLDVQTHPLLRGTPSSLPSYVSARNFALALLETLRDGSQAPLFAQAESTIARLPDGWGSEENAYAVRAGFGR
jgi:hypothetical protein